MSSSNNEPGRIDHCLKLQKFVTAAVAVILILSGLSATPAAAGANSRSGTIHITARVLERTSMQVLSQVPELNITNADIVRGYVEVQAGSRITVKTNNITGYLLAFEPLYDAAALFRTVIVYIGGREVQLLGSGWIEQPFVQDGITQDISYRFLLSREARPGMYPWPLSLSVLPLGGR